MSFIRQFNEHLQSELEGIEESQFEKEDVQVIELPVDSLEDTAEDNIAFFRHELNTDAPHVLEDDRLLAHVLGTGELEFQGFDVIKTSVFEEPLVKDASNNVEKS